MEKRIGKIIVGSAGGNSGKSSKGYKISLPSKWVKELALAEQEIEISFDGEKITIAPFLAFDDFLNKKKALKHKLIIFNFFDKDILCTQICADFTDKTISVQNKTTNIIKTAFGKIKAPTWEEFQAFLEERCVPKSRSGIREYLEAIGVEEYSPIEIIKKTHGKMAEDSQWLEMEEI
ncbi:MAG: hypothetical protein E7480_06015 [Ruminococcaceae bacterium]|nr:hypothetical protein [Oscillospiraceae bacterium]